MATRDEDVVEPGLAMARALIDLVALMTTDQTDELAETGDPFFDIAVNVSAEHIGDLVGVEPERLQILTAAAALVIQSLLERLVDEGTDSPEQVHEWLRKTFAGAA